MPIPSGSADQGILPFSGLENELSALRDEVSRLRAENARLLRLLELTPQQARRPGPVQTGVFDGVPGPVHAGSPASAKVAFFASLFASRPDVYALRWENARSGRAGWVPAVRGGWRKGVPAAEREHLPLTEEVLTAHLSGELELGLYPLLDGDRCHGWAPTSMAPPPCWTRSPTSRPPVRSAPRRHWRCPGPGGEPTSVCSSPPPSLRPPRDNSAPDYCARPSPCAAGWTWRATTGSSRPRTSCRSAASAT